MECLGRGIGGVADADIRGRWGRLVGSVCWGREELMGVARDVLAREMKGERREVKGEVNVSALGDD